jgi:hypothetical protein
MAHVFAIESFKIGDFLNLGSDTWRSIYSLVIS